MCYHPIYSERQTCGRISRGHTEGRSHRTPPPSFCGSCLNFYREKGSTISFPQKVKYRFPVEHPYDLNTVRVVLRGHQKVVFRRQKRTTFDVKNSTYLFHFLRRPFYAPGHLSNRITHDIQPHTSQLHSVQQLTLMFTIVRCFEYWFSKTNCCTAVDACQSRCSAHHVAAIHK